MSLRISRSFMLATIRRGVRFAKIAESRHEHRPPVPRRQQQSADNDQQQRPANSNQPTVSQPTVSQPTVSQPTVSQQPARPLPAPPEFMYTKPIKIVDFMEGRRFMEGQRRRCH
jgi:hypothetical protein